MTKSRHDPSKSCVNGGMNGLSCPTRDSLANIDVQTGKYKPGTANTWDAKRVGSLKIPIDNKTQDEFFTSLNIDDNDKAPLAWGRSIQTQSRLFVKSLWSSQPDPNVYSRPDMPTSSEKKSPLD